ncbi:hypothetical protein DIPPA_07533 [Diplonema papillatum]|nr:hypothetical protein DIPPA_07533 [Diplonema papillatum]
MSREEWRDPDISDDIDPLPAPGSTPFWKHLTLEYFCKSRFYDALSLTSLLRSLPDEESVRVELNARTGRFYSVECEGRIPVVIEFFNESENGKCVRRTPLNYYSIIGGRITKVPTLQELSAMALEVVASSCCVVCDGDIEDLLTGLEVYAESVAPKSRSWNDDRSTPAPKLRKRTRPAGTLVKGLLDEYEADEIRRVQRLKEQQEHAAAQELMRQRAEAALKAAQAADSFEKVRSHIEPVTFIDPRSSKTLVFSAEGGRLIYTVDGEPRPAIGIVGYVPEKRILKFPETKKGAQLPDDDEIVLALSAMCTALSVKHNLPSE